jgi:transposase
LFAAEGMKLGRPVGGAKNLKLDKHADKIDGYLAKGINKVAIAKLLDVSPNTLYEWLKVRRPSSAPPACLGRMARHSPLLTE